MLIGSGISMGSGIGNLTGALEDLTYLEDQSSGTFTVNENESWDIQVYIIHPVDCESVDLTIVDSMGNNAIESEYGCYNDDMMNYTEGDRELYALVDHKMSGMEYTLNSNVEVDITGYYCDEACMEEAIGGGIAIAGGFMGICCSVLILIIGIIMAFTLNDHKTYTVMQVGQMPVGQATYQAPITGQAPVAQTMYQPPVEQNPQPVAVPVTPINPPLTQQPPVEQQPAQTPFWDENPPQ